MEYCNALPTLVIPESVKTIKGYVFYSCDNLTEIVIPKNVEYIGEYTFYECDKLIKVVFEDTEGWSYYNYHQKVGSISSGKLSDYSTAANYLRKTYDGYFWKKIK